jgi:hypothetical protein
MTQWRIRFLKPFAGSALFGSHLSFLQGDEVLVDELNARFLIAQSIAELVAIQAGGSFHYERIIDTADMLGAMSSSYFKLLDAAGPNTIKEFEV